MMDSIQKYFPDLSARQLERFEALMPLYEDWNSKINVISRKDLENLYLRHVLHSLSIARLIHFGPGADVLDLGTGGGFPGIPLAIFFPQTNFTLIDGTRKKIRVVQEVADALQLDNVSARQVRAEELKKQRFDFVLSRGVAVLEKLVPWTRPLLKREHEHSLPNGLICLKGGRIKAEVAALPKGEYVELHPIRKFFEEEFFEEKVIVYVQGL
ncbi:MAG: 16S rRNA (guanine(527)-N(7))-methyltransferase RsmG [Bacteroidota bacterium]